MRHKIGRGREYGDSTDGKVPHEGWPYLDSFEESLESYGLPKRAKSPKSPPKESKPLNLPPNPAPTAAANAPIVGAAASHGWLAATLDAQYQRNEGTLRRIKKWLVALWVSGTHSMILRSTWSSTIKSDTRRSG